MGKWKDTGRLVTVLSAEGLGLTMAVQVDEDRLLRLAQVAARTRRGTRGMGAFRLTLVPDSRAYLAKHRLARDGASSATEAPPFDPTPPRA